MIEYFDIIEFISFKKLWFLNKSDIFCLLINFNLQAFSQLIDTDMEQDWSERGKEKQFFVYSHNITIRTHCPDM